MNAPSVAGALRSVEGEWLTFRQAWRGTVFSSFLGPLLYLGAIGFGLGSLVEADGAGLGVGRDGEPLTYLAFLAPGLVAATGVQVAANEGIFGTMGRVRWRRTWFTAVGTPLMPADLALGHLLWIAARAALAAGVYALVTVLFGVLDPLPALLTVGPAVLGGIALGCLLSAWLVVSAEDHAMNAANRFIVIPMFLFSGVFFPVEQLPDWMEPIARATPMWHAVALGRATALGTEPPWGAAVHLLVLGAMVALGFGLCVRNFRRRLLS